MSEIKTFDLIGLREEELTFLTNATFDVTIKSKDARFVVDLQTKLVNLLQSQDPKGDTAEAVAVE